MTITAEQLADVMSEALEKRGMRLIAEDELAALNDARDELAALRAELDEERRADHAPSSHGCGDNSCVIERPRGMATNGGCRCGRAALKSALWRAREERDAARAEGAAAEREACALIADDAEDSARRAGCPAEAYEAARIASVIRARSNGGAT